METITLTDILNWSQDPIQTCGEQPVILAAEFNALAADVKELSSISLTKDEVLNVFKEQAKRFSACGANNSEKFGVLRKHPVSGWNYLEVLLTSKPE